MGVSTDAVLFYGYCWDEERVRLFGDDSDATDWARMLARKRGHVNPWDGYREPPRSAYTMEEDARIRGLVEAWKREHRAALDAWHDAVRDIEKEFGCEIGHHCSGEYGIPYVYAEKSLLRARRGYPAEVKGLVVDPAWPGRLARFVAELAITPPQDAPRWWLVSYWG